MYDVKFDEVLKIENIKRLENIKIIKIIKTIKTIKISCIIIKKNVIIIYIII